MKHFILAIVVIAILASLLAGQQTPKDGLDAQRWISQVPGEGLPTNRAIDARVKALEDVTEKQKLVINVLADEVKRLRTEVDQIKEKLPK